MTRVLSQAFFLSRFPRFKLSVQSLLRVEEEYTLVSEPALRAVIAAVDVAAPAPRCFEDFAAATRADVPAWPTLYVHRYNVAGALPGAVVNGYKAREHAQFVGTVRQAAERIASGEGLNRYRQVSVGGTGRFDVPPL